MDNEVESILEDCENVMNVSRSAGGPGFTTWEKDFLESIREQYDMRGTLSDRQQEILQEIWDKI